MKLVYNFQNYRLAKAVCMYLFPHDFSHCRKFELYSMEWMAQVDLEKFIVAAAAYGGPVGNAHYLLLKYLFLNNFIYSYIYSCLLLILTYEWPTKEIL